MRRTAKLLGRPCPEHVKRQLSEHNKALGIKPSAEATRRGNANRGLREAHPSWKGGTSMVNGYRCVYRPEHPRRHPNGYVYEHIVVAEAVLGRALRAGEVVHHLDGIKTNNLPANLVVLSSQVEHIRLHRAQGNIA